MMICLTSGIIFSQALFLVNGEMIAICHTSSLVLSCTLDTISCDLKFRVSHSFRKKCIKLYLCLSLERYLQEHERLVFIHEKLHVEYL